MKVRVCPNFDALFTGCYFDGLRQVFGPRQLRFTLDGFPRFEVRSNWYQGDDLAFIVEDSGLKVFVDPHDSSSLSPVGLAWCDVYGKCSFDPTEVPPDCAHKAVPIGPSFPTRVLGAWGTAWQAGHNYWLARSRITDLRRHFSHWRRLHSFRLPPHAYVPASAETDFVFFCAALWGDGQRGNQERKLFIDACRSLTWLKFEGGFDKAVAMPPLPGYMVPFRRSHSDYLRNVQRSTVVFNSPARLDCHGWKLGEFLALGKAIISTPLVRKMPAPLIHGQHAHFVERSVVAMRDAVHLICRDADYRRHLEEGARAYFLEHLQPRRAIERLLRHGQAHFAPTESDKSAVYAPAGLASDFVSGRPKVEARSL